MKKSTDVDKDLVQPSIMTQEKKYTGARGEFAPKMPKRAPKICIEFNSKQIKECYFRASKLEK